MCEIIKIGDTTAFICKGNHSPIDHECNEDATVYDLRSGERVTLIEEGGYYKKYYKEILSGSVACSICGRAAIDNAPYM